MQHELRCRGRESKGYYESRLAMVLASLLEAFCQEHDIGIVLGADATTALGPGLVRLPDVKLVWYVYAQTRTVRVYTSPGRVLELREDQMLDGSDVLPGFSVQIRDGLKRAEPVRNR